jgi:chemotaxis methyl-accepting protein methylase
MERLNLNVSKDTRERIRRIARRRNLKDAEAARELLTEAVERDERDEFYRRMEEAQTPELRERLSALTHAMEKLGGVAR